MRTHLSSLFLFLALLGGRLAASAQTFSYIYIQGDKKTPFYVKLDGEMAPRFGKNYCILPQLAAGPTRLQILYQQNAYPAQEYTVQVPDGGSRSFMLALRNGAYQLYDLEQDFYLSSGNKAEDDHMPGLAPSAPALARQEDQPDPVVATPEPARQRETARKPPARTGTDKPARTRPILPKPVAKKPATTQRPSAASGEPAFLGDLELDNQKSAGSAAPGLPAGAGSAPRETATVRPARIPNSDCPTAISTEAFSSLFSRLGGRNGDEDKLRYLDGQMDKCYESWQARSLAGSLEGDAARFILLKKIYPRITDQEAFPLLDDVLSSSVWKTEFQRLVHPE